jgi:hypothetical protein
MFKPPQRGALLVARHGSAGSWDASDDASPVGTASGDPQDCDVVPAGLLDGSDGASTRDSRPGLEEGCPCGAMASAAETDRERRGTKKERAFLPPLPRGEEGRGGEGPPYPPRIAAINL